MKYFLTLLLLTSWRYTTACGGGDWLETDRFYNLFEQKNIADESFYAFLRNDDGVFYGESYYEEKPEANYKGNIALWQETLTNWSKEEIRKAFYKGETRIWDNKDSKTDKVAKQYLDFARKCNAVFTYRKNRYSWNYNELKNNSEKDYQSMISEAQKLQLATKNEHIRNRYFYQIIRLMHYSQNWQDAIFLFENNIENKITKNELYYYITDQVAGCYYSMKNYEKAAYLFSKVVNKSIDRKKSAYLSFNFCTNYNAEGKLYFDGIEDQKDLLFMKSIRAFSDEIKGIRDFIELDANDSRVELLFARALSNVERVVWTKYIGMANKQMPDFSEKGVRLKISQLLSICIEQINDEKVVNKDYWRIVDSYLSFIYGETTEAQNKLSLVKTFEQQKNALEMVFTVFSWENISSENETYLYSKTKNYFPFDASANDQKQADLIYFILDKVANKYYKSGALAKAFLIHNYLSNLENTSSLELIDNLLAFVHKENKNNFEQLLLSNSGKDHPSDYLQYQKGIYFLNTGELQKAKIAFEKNKFYSRDEPISKLIFSNNTVECFECEANNVMQDKVQDAELFSFIKLNFDNKELCEYLLKLELLRTDETVWKAKLANYLLGNYYFNISNTGYYRGILNQDGNCCNYNYFDYYWEDKNAKAAQKIKEKKGFNLFNIEIYNKRYYQHSNRAMQYYQNVIALSKDRELNARCLYMIAKCELNSFYNNDERIAFSIPLKYGKIDLPGYEKSFLVLKDDYSDTQFYNMIIDECSYFKYYAQ